MRCASITWWRISRAQAWLSALTEANMVATQSTPPAICWAKAPRGSKDDGKEHHDQEREKEHGVDGVFGAPLDAQVLGEMGPEGRGIIRPCVDHVLSHVTMKRDWGTRFSGGGLGNVGGLDFDVEGMRGLQIVVRAENELRAARAGGDADLVEEDRGLVDVDGEDFS